MVFAERHSVVTGPGVEQVGILLGLRMAFLLAEVAGLKARSRYFEVEEKFSWVDQSENSEEVYSSVDHAEEGRSSVDHAEEERSSVDRAEAGRSSVDQAEEGHPSVDHIENSAGYQKDLAEKVHLMTLKEAYCVQLADCQYLQSEDKIDAAAASAMEGTPDFLCRPFQNKS